MPTTRRQFLSLAGSVTAAGTIPIITLRPLEATPAMLTTAIRNVVGEAQIRTGKVKLDIPPLVENGNTVPLSIAVDSPMTEADHVQRIAVFNERNPLPNVITVDLGPRAGAARIATHIRLATSQRILALAVMSDGSVWSDSAEVIVTLAACVEG